LDGAIDRFEISQMLLDDEFLPRANLTQALVDPKLGELFLDVVLGQARSEITPIHVIERLVLIEAGEHHRLFSRARILVELETLRANLLS
jgi:hypothetical protein